MLFTSFTAKAPSEFEAKSLAFFVAFYFLSSLLGEDKWLSHQTEIQGPASVEQICSPAAHLVVVGETCCEFSLLQLSVDVSCWIQGWWGVLPGWRCRPAGCITNLRALGSACYSSSHFTGKWFTLRLCTKSVLGWRTTCRFITQYTALLFFDSLIGAYLQCVSKLSSTVLSW